MNNPMKRWLLILAVMLLAVSVACGGSSTPVGEGQSGSNVNEGDLVNKGKVLVEAKEFSFSLSATEAAAGTVTFVVENSGNMPHDFAIRGNGIEETTPQIDPGESATLTVELEPGTYTYICTIPGHEQLGMRGTFTVSPS